MLFRSRLEALGRSEEEYIEQQEALKKIKEKTALKKDLQDRMLKMKEDSIGELEERQRENKRLQTQKQELFLK